MKLLKETAEVLRRGQRDEMIALAERIDAALSAPPSDSAMELLKKILDLYVDYEIDVDGMTLPWDEPARSQAENFYRERKEKFTAEAAALIDEARAVPRAMLEDVAEIEAGLIQYYGEYTKLTNASMKSIVAKYGRTIKE